MIDQQVEVESPIESLDILVKTMKNALSVPLPALRILVALKKTSTRSGAVSCSDNGVRQLELGAKVWEKEAAVVKELVPLLLDSRCWRLLQETFCSWWRMLPAAAKEHLTPLLVISLRDPSKISNDVTKKNSQKVPKDPQLVSLSSSGLHLEPLSLLACSPKVFRTPLLGIVLDLLLELLTSCRRICLAAATDGGRDGGIKREEVAAALVAQDSAACQILLEACLPVAELGDDTEPRPLLEARSLICATISSLIHTTSLLLKLLHFQGYEPSLVPMMVEGVPSMVQCLEFVGELMQQPPQQSQVFAVILTAHIVCSHSSLPQSLNAAQQVRCLKSFTVLAVYTMRN
jgi:integrator complex subunit 2